MLHKTLQLEIKSADAATGIIRAYVAGFGNIDRVGDIIIRGAFLKTIPQFLADGVVLWNHDTNTPIGKPLDAGEDEKGLWVEFQLILTIPKAREIFDLMQAGVIQKFSFGYDVLSRVWLTTENMSEYAPKDATPSQIACAMAYGAALLEIELYEISPVSIPANPNTGIESIKELKTKELAALAPEPKGEPKPEEEDLSVAIARTRAAKRRAAMRPLFGV